MILFKHIDDKDVFRLLYARKLLKHLIYRTSPLDKASMISKLKIARAVSSTRRSPSICSLCVASVKPTMSECLVVLGFATAPLTYDHAERTETSLSIACRIYVEHVRLILFGMEPAMRRRVRGTSRTAF